MSRSVGLAHILRNDHAPATGVWGVFTLQSAFQPIFAFRDGKLSVAAFEGLIRPAKDGVPISPGAFFASVPTPDRLHVETLARTLHLLNAGRYLDPNSMIFVNFDPSVFADVAVADVALREMRLVLHEAAINPGRIVCEVTEQKAPSPGALSDFVAALRRHGYRIAVDDYGAEDSDIFRIDELRPDIVKFDAKWITHLMESGPGVALLAAMVKTFAARNIETVFEGLEEPWQLEVAERAGASMVQGYVLARPELAPTTFAAFTAGAAAQAAAEEARLTHAIRNAPAAAIVPPPNEHQPRPIPITRGATFGRRKQPR